MHMGSTIKLKMLQDWSNEINGGYIVPPIGGYYTHYSTTERTGRVLETHLQDRWAQPGTRRRDGHDDDLNRYICKVQKSGPENRVTNELDLPAMHEKATWLTEAPPGTPEVSCGRRPRHRGEGGSDKIGDGSVPFEATRCADDSDEDTRSSKRQRRMPRDPTAGSQGRSHKSRVKSAHTLLYCQRIFAKPGSDYDAPWRRPQATGILQDGRAKTVIHGWVPPEVHSPGDSLLAVASKAPPRSSASSSAVPKSGAQSVPDRRPVSSPINVSDDSDNEGPLSRQSLWNLLDPRSSSPRGRRDA